MKKFTIMLALTTSLISANANALEGVLTYFAVGIPLVSTSMAFGWTSHKEEAQLIIADAQEYSQSGKLSAFLAQRVQDVMAANNALSIEEAIDVLTEIALESEK